jgi:hypothetical protein
VARLPAPSRSGYGRERNSPDGSFGDQGGGAGIHGWNAYITKPWMGLMATGGMVDYIERAACKTCRLRLTHSVSTPE